MKVTLTSQVRLFQYRLLLLLV